MAWPILVLVGAGAAVATPGEAAVAALAGAATLTPRPEACAPSEGVWERTRREQIHVWCTALARGYVVLERDPAQAAELAATLLKSELESAGRTLLARAQLAQGDAKRAWANFQRAERVGKSPLTNLEALRDSAIAASRVGQREQAVARYRIVAAQWRLLRARDRAAVLVEAAMAALRMDSGGEVAEAQRYLSVAARQHQFRGGLPIVQAAGAFAAARGGKPPSQMPDLDDPGIDALVAKGNSKILPRLLEGELAALTAASNERSDRDSAVEAWRRYLKAPISESQRGWVQARIAALAGGG